MKKVFKRILISLNLTTEISAEEKLENLIRENKQNSLVDDILSIRRSGNYIPDYNKEPAFKDYKMLNSDLEAFSMEVITAQNRPEDFGNNVEAWLGKVKEDHKKDLDKEKNRELAFQQMMNDRYKIPNQFMAKFLRVD